MIKGYIDIGEEIHAIPAKIMVKTKLLDCDNCRGYANRVTVMLVTLL